MTVLSQYDRLECPGVWRADADAQNRNVFVTLGKATIVIQGENDVALSHWSLPAMDRINPGTMPALYRPGAESRETLEIDDTTMVEAIETVRSAIRRRAPHHGRIRGFAGWALTVLAAIAAVIWVPQMLRSHTAALIPPVVQAELGERLLTHLVPVTGPTCANGSSLAAADRLSDRLFGEDARRVAVLSGGPIRTMSLPGGILLIHRDLIENARMAETPAGYLLAEAARADASQPLARLLDESSLWTSVRLLTSGQVSDEALARFAENLPLDPPVATDPTALGARFATARVDPAPYLFDLSARGLSAPTLNNAASDTQAVLPDADWVRLQDICAG